MNAALDPVSRPAPRARAAGASPVRAPRPGLAASRAALALAAAFTVTLGIATLIKYRFYLYNDFDLAVFAQAVDRLLHGSTFVSIRGMSWLGDHASYVLVLFAPLVALVRHPATLLLIQGAVLGLGAIPVHRLSRRALAGDAGHASGLATVVTAAYLLQPALAYVGLFEFHPEVVATTALLFTIDALVSRRTRACLLWAGLAMLAREDVALVVAGLGVIAVLFRRPRATALGVTLVVAAVAVLALTLLVVRPHFASAAAQYGAMYRGFGDSPGEVIAGLVRDPLRAIQTLFTTPGDALDSRLKAEWYLHLLLPLGFLPLLAPATLLAALPVLAEHMLSSRPQQHTIVFQYSALLLPILIAAAIDGLGRLARIDRRLARGAAVAMLAGAVFGQIAFGPLGAGWLQSRHAIERVVPSARDRIEAPIRDAMVARLPAKGGVIAGFEFLSRLTRRDDVHSLHHVLGGTYTYSKAAYPDPTPVAAVLADWSHARLRPYADGPGAGRRIGGVIARSGLVAVAAAGDLVLFEHGAAGLPLVTPERDRAVAPAEVRARADGVLEFLGARLGASLDPASGIVTLETEWRRTAPTDAVYLMRLDILDAAGRTVDSHTRILGYVVWPVTDWPRDVPVLERYHLLPGTRLAPGRYDVRMGLARLGADMPLRIETAPGDPFLLGSFSVDR